MIVVIIRYHPQQLVVQALDLSESLLKNILRVDLLTLRCKKPIVVTSIGIKDKAFYSNKLEAVSSLEIKFETS